jgi:hypothetical protein
VVYFELEHFRRALAKSFRAVELARQRGSRLGAGPTRGCQHARRPGAEGYTGCQETLTAGRLFHVVPRSHQSDRQTTPFHLVCGLYFFQLKSQRWISMDREAQDDKIDDCMAVGMRSNIRVGRFGMFAGQVSWGVEASPVFATSFRSGCGRHGELGRQSSLQRGMFPTT